MTEAKVKFASRAQAQANQIASWWHNNRTAAPALFDDELDDALKRLRLSPESGRLYTTTRRSRRVRRLLLLRTRYHLYYAVDDRLETITILAVWHALRGKAPTL